MKIVVAVDGSKYGRWATDWVARLPLVDVKQVTALHVVDLTSLKMPLVPHPVPAWDAPYVRKETERLEERAAQVVKETRARFASLKIQATVLSEHGPVAETILQQASGAGRLTVIGSRGLDALDRFMLGSVSTKVIHHAKGSVLVVREPARPIRRIVYATDGSKPSLKALRFLQRQLIPKKDKGPAIEVAVLYAMPLLKYPELKEPGHRLVETAAAKLDQAGYLVEPVFKIGHPADEIIKFAERRQSDVIVTGARGRGAIARFLLGSVSTRLVQHSPCSVLVVR
jgi:nucleotide-binding universal stress UspA family protein